MLFKATFNQGDNNEIKKAVNGEIFKINANRIIFRSK